MLVPVSKNNDQLSFTRQINSVFSYDVHMQTLKSRNALLLHAMPRLSCTLSTTDRRSDVDWKATCTWVCMSCNCLYSLYLTFLHVNMWSQTCSIHATKPQKSCHTEAAILRIALHEMSHERCSPALHLSVTENLFPWIQIKIKLSRNEFIVCIKYWLI